MVVVINICMRAIRVCLCVCDLYLRTVKQKNLFGASTRCFPNSVDHCV